MSVDKTHVFWYSNTLSCNRKVLLFFHLYGGITVVLRRLQRVEPLFIDNKLIKAGSNLSFRYKIGQKGTFYHDGAILYGRQILSLLCYKIVQFTSGYCTELPPPFLKVSEQVSRLAKNLTQFGPMPRGCVSSRYCGHWWSRS